MDQKASSQSAGGHMSEKATIPVRNSSRAHCQNEELDPHQIKSDKDNCDPPDFFCGILAQTKDEGPPLNLNSKLIQVKENISVLSSIVEDDPSKDSVAPSSSSIETKVSHLSALTAPTTGSCIKAASRRMELMASCDVTEDEDVQRYCALQKKSAYPELPGTQSQPMAEVDNNIATGFLKTERTNASLSLGLEHNHTKSNLKGSVIPHASSTIPAFDDDQQAEVGAAASSQHFRDPRQSLHGERSMYIRNLPASRFASQIERNLHLRVDRPAAQPQDYLSFLEQDLGIHVRDADGAVNLSRVRESLRPYFCLACREKLPDVTLLDCGHKILCCRCFHDEHFQPCQDMPCPVCGQPSRCMLFSEKMMKFILKRSE